MKITYANNANSTYTGNNNSNQDAQLKSIQQQIENVNKQIKQLNSNDNMDAKQKMEKKKELDQKLQELTQRLATRQAEIRTESAEKKQQSTATESAVQSEAKDQLDTSTFIGLSLSDSALKQVEKNNQVRVSMQGETGVLKQEIKLDKGRGVDTSKKETQLSNLNEKLSDLSEENGKVLSKAKKAVNAAQKSEEDKEKSNDTKNDKATGELKAYSSDAKENSLEDNPKLGEYVDINL